MKSITKSITISVLLIFLISLQLKAQDTIAKNKKDLLSKTGLSGLKFRSIGPAFMSGRISDLAVNPENPAEYYVAVASGGLWKTTNSGITFTPVFDKQKVFSIGCVTIDPNNPFVIWVGTGENNSQRSVAYGDGVYRSNDGGKSWKNMGLKSSEHIGKIIIDPGNSDVVYVASQGPLWGPGGERGLYKTTNGGKNWKQVLAISENTGVTDITFDPRNSDVLYAAAYQRRRHVFTLINGGPESAIYKSTDAGENWVKLKSGLPDGDVGRIGLAVSPANPDVVYAIIEASENKGGIFRSVDRGASWQKRNSYMTTSPQYYNELVADPHNVDRIYSLDTYTKISEDGGKTLKNLGNKSRHVDDHALWIDPKNTDHLLIGGDGGLYETYDRGRIWDFKSNLPVTQFYRVSVDNSLPFYYVYGGTQDNNTQGGPSRTTNVAGIVNSDWFVTKGGDGFETQIDPKDPNIVYSQSQYGWLVRFNKKTGEKVRIKPQEHKGEKPYRWNWDSPLIISPHSNTRLYFAANKLFKSDDRGDTWEVISDDLTRQIDRNKLEVMGKVWNVDAVSKNASTSFYGNIVSLSESSLEEGLIYVGTDDGLINITEDGGRNWREIKRLHGIPKNTYVSCIITSQHEANTVYAAFDNHKNNDFKPYILRSTNAGKSWKSISGNLPERETVYSIVEDHVNPNLLFAGTEFGVYFTNDGGKNWRRLRAGLPTIAVKDIAIQKRENDLVLGTFGRSFYILDDYSPLRYITKEMVEKKCTIFPIKDALMFVHSRPLGGGGKSCQGESYYTAPNPPLGAVITYYLNDTIKTRKQKRKAAEKKAVKEGKNVPYPGFDELRAEDNESKPYLLFTIYDEKGNVVRKMKTSVKNGINRIVWDFRYYSTGPVRIEPDTFSKTFAGNAGFLALPGEYNVTISKCENGKITSLAGPEKFKTVSLNKIKLSDEDMLALKNYQEKARELQRVVYGTQRYVTELDNKIQYIRSAYISTPGATDEMIEKISAIENKLKGIKRAFYGDKSLSNRNENTPPSINDRLRRVIYGIWNNTGAPTQTQQDECKIVTEEFKQQLSKIKELVDVDMKSIEKQMKEAGSPWIPGQLPE